MFPSTNATALFHFNDITNLAKDETGKTWNVTGNLIYDNSNLSIGPSCLFYNKEMYLSYPNAETLLTESGDFTIEMRIVIPSSILPFDLGDTMCLFQCYNSDKSITEDINESWLALFLYRSSSGFRVMLKRHANDNFGNNNYDLLFDQAYHIIVTRNTSNNNSISVWIDEVQVISQANYTGKMGGAFSIGHAGVESLNTYNLCGIIDEFKIANTVIYTTPSTRIEKLMYTATGTEDIISIPNGTDTNEGYRKFKFLPPADPSITTADSSKTFYHYLGGTGEENVLSDLDTTGTSFEEAMAGVEVEPVPEEEVAVVYPGGTDTNEGYRKFRFLPPADPSITASDSSKTFYHYLGGTGEENVLSDLDAAGVSFEEAMDGVEVEPVPEEEVAVVYPSGSDTNEGYVKFKLLPPVSNTGGIYYYYIGGPGEGNELVDLDITGEAYDEAMSEVEVEVIPEEEMAVIYPSGTDTNEGYRKFKYFPLLSEVEADKMYYYWKRDLEQDTFDPIFSYTKSYDTMRRLLYKLTSDTFRLCDDDFTNYRAFVFM